MATLQELLGGGLPAGLLSAEQEAAAERRAQNAALLNFAFGALQASRGQPGQGAPGLGQIIGQAGPVGVQAYQQSFDQTLANTLRGMQLAEMRRKQTQQEAGRTALQRAYERMSGMTAEGALAAPGGQVGPTTERAAMIGQRQPVSQQELLALSLNPNIDPEAAKRIIDMAQLSAPKAAPGVVGEYEAAIARGLIPPTTTLQQYVELKKPPAPSATAIAGGKATPFEEAAQKAQATVFSAIQESGTKASRSLQSVNRLENLLQKVDTGGVAAFQQIAGNLGIPSKGLSDIQAAQAIINRLVPEQRPPGSGTMSDADLALYKESLPRIINQPNANRLIVNSMKNINSYLIKEGQIASDVLDGKISPAEGRRKLIELGNPVQEFFNENPNLIGAVPQVSTEDRNLINKYLGRR